MNHPTNPAPAALRKPWNTPVLRTMPANHTQAGPTPVIPEGPLAYGS